MSNQKLPETLGELLRSVRERRQMSLRALEELSGISNGYLSQLEHDRVKTPSRDVLGKLAQALRVPSGMLMGKAGYLINTAPAGSSTHIPDALIEVTKSFEDEDWDNLIRFARFILHEKSVDHRLQR